MGEIKYIILSQLNNGEYTGTIEELFEEITIRVDPVEVDFFVVDDRVSPALFYLFKVPGEIVRLNDVDLSDYSVDVKTLNTNNTSSITAESSESISGTGVINLHKISKTGSYNDLLDKPDTSNFVTLDGTETITGTKTFTGSNIFTNESKFTHATYAPTWKDIAPGIGKSSCFSRGAFMQLITGQILLPNAGCTNTDAGVTGGYETEADVLKFQTMTAAAGQPTVATVASINASGISTTGLALTSTDGIAYSDGTNKINMIKFITGSGSGHGIIMGGNGAVIIGAGESADRLQTALGVGGNTEYLYLGSDQEIEFYSNCNADSAGNRKQSIYRNSGDLDICGKIISQGLTITDGENLSSRTKIATWQYNSSTDCIELAW